MQYQIESLAKLLLKQCYAITKGNGVSMQKERYKDFVED